MLKEESKKKEEEIKKIPKTPIQKLSDQLSKLEFYIKTIKNIK